MFVEVKSNIDTALKVSQTNSTLFKEISSLRPICELKSKITPLNSEEELKEEKLIKSDLNKEDDVKNILMVSAFTTDFLQEDPLNDCLEIINLNVPMSEPVEEYKHDSENKREDKAIDEHINDSKNEHIYESIDECKDETKDNHISEFIKEDVNDSKNGSIYKYIDNPINKFENESKPKNKVIDELTNGLMYEYVNK